MTGKYTVVFKLKQYLEISKQSEETLFCTPSTQQKYTKKSKTKVNLIQQWDIMKIGLALNTFLPKKKSTSNRMNTKSCPGVQVTQETKLFLPVINARLFWAQEAGGTIEHQWSTRMSCIWYTYICKSKSASLGTSGLPQTCCISYCPQMGRGGQEERRCTTMVPHLLNHSCAWPMVESMDKKRQGPSSQRPQQSAPQLLFLPWSSPEGPQGQKAK